MTTCSTTEPLFITKRAPPVRDHRGSILVFLCKLEWLKAHRGEWRVYHDADYIIDAPDQMPAGACEQGFVPSDNEGEPDIYMAFQVECSRP